MPNEIAPRTPAGLAVSEEQLDRMLEEDRAAQDDALSVPLLKVGQGLSKAVQKGNVSLGEFYNSLTNETYEQPVPFVIAHYARGRFWSPQGENRGFRAPHQGPIPWPEHPDYGRTFAESSEVEENWSTPWKEEAPPIATTHEFTGLVVGSQQLPVRLSLMRASARTGRTIAQLLRLDRRPWDHTYALTARAQQGKKGDYYIVEAEQSPAPDEEYRDRAIELYMAVKNQGASAVDADAEEVAPEPAERENALDV